MPVLGEVVMVAAVEYPLPVGRRPQVVVGGVRSGDVVEVIDLEFLEVVVDRLDGLLQIVAGDVRADDHHLAGVYQYVLRIVVHGFRVLGASDHVHVEVGHHGGQIDGRKLGEVLRAPQSSFFAAHSTGR